MDLRHGRCFGAVPDLDRLRTHFLVKGDRCAAYIGCFSKHRSRLGNIHCEELIFSLSDTVLAILWNRAHAVVVESCAGGSRNWS